MFESMLSPFLCWTVANVDDFDFSQTMAVFLVILSMINSLSNCKQDALGYNCKPRNSGRLDSTQPPAEICSSQTQGGSPNMKTQSYITQNERILQSYSEESWAGRQMQWSTTKGFESFRNTTSCMYSNYRLNLTLLKMEYCISTSQLLATKKIQNHNSIFILLTGSGL